MVFVMFWGALFMSVSVEAQRGLFAGYSANFDFPAILSVQTRREFMEVTLPQISKAAKSYFPVSSRYFQVKQDVERGAGPTQMVGEMTYFGGIMEMRGPMFSLSVPTYSWTVWVKARKVLGHLLLD
ncbi:hypothetical protein T484DRAFT_1778769 [Baffinella frigidus]|nr:hypothetical protein T484DRAFT_1778769 [Cryptophyta sp. CCMP2293]